MIVILILILLIMNLICCGFFILFIVTVVHYHDDQNQNFYENTMIKKSNITTKTIQCTQSKRFLLVLLKMTKKCISQKISYILTNKKINIMMTNSMKSRKNIMINRINIITNQTVEFNLVLSVYLL